MASHVLDDNPIKCTFLFHKFIQIDIDW